MEFVAVASVVARKMAADMSRRQTLRLKAMTKAQGRMVDRDSDEEDEDGNLAGFVGDQGRMARTLVVHCISMGILYRVLYWNCRTP